MKRTAPKRRRAPTVIQEIRSLREWVIRATASVSACEARCAVIDERVVALHRKLSEAVSEIRKLSEPLPAETSDAPPHRTCGVCGISDIPRGVDWPWWVNGQPVHPICLPRVEKGAETVKVPVLQRSEVQKGFDDPD